MKKFVLFLGLALIGTPAFAQNAAQQDKMKACNADAAKQGLKGDPRKAFMKECLSAKKDVKEVHAAKEAATPAKAALAAKAEEKKLTASQARMKKCNSDAAAKSIKGDERKKFMSECLKSS